jgi:hypothetical protein
MYFQKKNAKIAAKSKNAETKKDAANKLRQKFQFYQSNSDSHLENIFDKIGF